MGDRLKPALPLAESEGDAGAGAGTGVAAGAAGGAVTGAGGAAGATAGPGAGSRVPAGSTGLMWNSTRRFFCRPASVLLSAIGLSGP